MSQFTDSLMIRAQFGTNCVSLRSEVSLRIRNVQVLSSNPADNSCLDVLSPLNATNKLGRLTYVFG